MPRDELELDMEIRFAMWRCGSMNRENQLIVTDEPIEFGKQLVEVQDFRKSPIILEESKDYTLFE